MSDLYDENEDSINVVKKSTTGNGDVTAVISLILGILSIIFPFGLISSCIFGIPAIILGRDNVERSEDKKSLAKAGRICGIIGLIFGVLWMLFIVGIFVYIINMS